MKSTFLDGIKSIIKFFADVWISPLPNTIESNEDGLFEIVFSEQSITEAAIGLYAKC